MFATAAWVAMVIGGVPPVFTDFLRPIAGAQASTDCVACHRQEAADWETTRHKMAFTNSIFLQGLVAEPHARCVHCHAPMVEQPKEVRQLVTTRAAPAGSLAHEGISCVTCHVLGSTEVDTRGHPATVEAPLGCATCHEFQAHEVSDGQTRIIDEPMQTTGSEWKRWGGAQTCEGCHMPGGSHAMKGAFDLPWLRGSVQVDVVGRVAVIRSIGVGHAFPTGDVFRHLVLWADDIEVARFGKTFRLEAGPDGKLHQRLKSDSSLQPGVPVRVALPTGTRKIRLTYHYTEERSPLPRDDTVVVLFER